MTTAKRPDIGDLAVAVVRHLWVHPVHDPKCEVCRVLRDGKSGKS